MAECPKCEGFGSVCTECGLELADCGCGEESRPYVCEECRGTKLVSGQICIFPDCETACPGRQPAEVAA